MALASAVFLALALGAFRWDLARELEHVRAARLEIRGQVDLLLTSRTRLEAVHERLALLASAEVTAPHPTLVLGTLASRLPDDAYLGAFRMSGDSVAVEGTADRATGVFDALRSDRLIAGLQASAPIRQEAADGDRSIERFALTLLLRQASDSVLQRTP
jgi:hypothetical protein